MNNTVLHRKKKEQLNKRKMHDSFFKSIENISKLTTKSSKKMKINNENFQKFSLRYIQKI